MIKFTGTFSLVVEGRVELPAEMIGELLARFNHCTHLGRLLAFARTCKAAWNVFADLPIARSTCPFFSTTAEERKLKAWVHLSASVMRHFDVETLDFYNVPSKGMCFHTSVDRKSFLPLDFDGKLCEVDINDGERGEKHVRLAVQFAVADVPKLAFWTSPPFERVKNDVSSPFLIAESIDPITRTLTLVYKTIAHGQTGKNLVEVEQTVLRGHLYEVRFSATRNTFTFIRSL